MNSKAQEIYEKITALPTKEYFCSSEDSAYSIPTELLIEKSEEHFLRLLCCKGELQYDKMSDFERFRLFLSNLYMMSGSAQKERFLEKVRGIFGEECISLLHDECACWKYMTEELLKNPCNAVSVNTLFGVETVKSLSLPMLFRVENYPMLVAKNLEFIRQNKDKAIVVDFSEYSFCRSDSFHCEEAYGELLFGKTENIDILICGLLYSIFEEAKKCNICLALKIGNNVYEAQKLLFYLRDRGVLSNAIIFADEKYAKSVACELCGEYMSGQESVYLFCGLDYQFGDTEHSISERIKRIASIYPIGLLRFGGSTFETQIYGACHNIVKKGMSDALSEICPDEKVAVKLAEHILY